MIEVQYGTVLTEEDIYGMRTTTIARERSQLKPSQVMHIFLVMDSDEDHSEVRDLRTHPR